MNLNGPLLNNLKNICLVQYYYSEDNDPIIQAKCPNSPKVMSTKFPPKCAKMLYQEQHCFFLAGGGNNVQKRSNLPHEDTGNQKSGPE